MYMDRPPTDDVDVEDDVGIRDLRFAATGILLIAGIAILLAIIS
jgi:hypothetical protein